MLWVSWPAKAGADPLLHWLHQLLALMCRLFEKKLWFPHGFVLGLVHLAHGRCYHAPLVAPDWIFTAMYAHAVGHMMSCSNQLHGCPHG
jgi:hypothetical protein